jgi:NADP-dependent 3-hydroxy acid dehydrogenase YdfG
MTMAGRLAGKVALVTGASSGIGEATAAALAAEGASVAISARRAERLDALKARIEAAGGTALAIPGDVADEATAIAAISRTVAALGRFDILVNNAGVIQSGGIADADIEEYRRVFDINLFAALHLSKAAIATMKAQGSGDIVNVSSLGARKPAAPFNSYTASKAALNAMSDAMRMELGGTGIRVITIMPGATATEVAANIANPQLRDAMTTHVGKDGAMMPDDVAQAIVFATSLPPRVTVSELAIRPTIDTTN